MKNALVDQLNVQVMPPDSAADSGSVMICINGTPKHHQKNNLFSPPCKWLELLADLSLHGLISPGGQIYKI